MPQQRVDIPGVGIIEFPDTMTGPEIDAAARKLYEEARGEMVWPPGERVEPGLGTRAARTLGRVGRAMQEPGRESIITPSPGLTPVERANLRARQQQRIPFAGTIYERPVPGFPGEPTQEEIQQVAFEPIIPLEPTAQKLWPKYEGIALPEQAERGLALGMSRVIEAFTSPASLITIGAAGGISAISNTLRVLIQVGFSGSLAAEAVIKAPEIIEHVKEGNYDEAIATGTEVAGYGAMGLGLGVGAVRGARQLPFVTGRALIPSPRRPGVLEPRVYAEGAGLEVLPAHEPVFPGRAAELPGTPAAGYLPQIPRSRAALPARPGAELPGEPGGVMGEVIPGERGPAPAARPTTVVPTRRPPRDLFEAAEEAYRRGEDPLAGEPVVTPETPRLLPPGPEQPLPRGGVRVTGVEPGEPGGLPPVRPTERVVPGRGVPVRVREPGRFRVREEGDPSSDLLRDEPVVQPEAPLPTRVTPPRLGEPLEPRVEPEPKVKIVRAPKTRQELGREWYREGTLEREISDHGGMELDLTLEEHARMLIQNIHAKTQRRSHSMFDPIRARKGEKALKPDEMLQALQDEGKVPERWDLNDFMEALTDRVKVTPEGEKYTGIPSLGMEETGDIFAMMEREGARRLGLPEPVEPEVPRPVEPRVPPARRREVGEPPRNIEEVEADWQRRREEIREMEASGEFTRADFDQLRLDNDVIRQRDLNRLRLEEREPVEPEIRPEAVQRAPRVEGLEEVGWELYEEANVELPLYRGQEAYRELFSRYGLPNVAPRRPGVREQIVGERSLFFDETTGEAKAFWEPRAEGPPPPGEPPPRAEPPEPREPRLPEVTERVATEGQEIVVESATEAGFDPADGEWGVFRRDPTGRKALLRQFEDLAEADRWAEEYRVPPAERAKPEVFPERVGMERPEEPGVRRPDIERIRRERGAGIEPTVEPEGLAVGDRVAFERADKPGTFEYGEVESFYADGKRARIKRDRGGFADVAIRELTEPAPRVEAPAEPTVGPEGRAVPAAPPGEGQIMARVRFPEADIGGGNEYSVIKTEAGWQPVERPIGTQEWRPLTLGDQMTSSPSGNMTGAKNRLYSRLAEIRRGVNVETPREVEYLDPRFERDFTEVLRQEDEIVRRALPEEPTTRAGLTEAESREQSAAYETEPLVEPEGQVEIVGHEGFLRQSRLADDKAALERILTAKPDPNTAAGREQIRELGKRERALRRSIAQQERELRAEPEQVGMFREDEPPLFEKLTPEDPARPPEPARPPSRAQEYVDTLKRDRNIEPEIGEYAQAYLDWKLGGQTEPAPRMAGNRARAFREVIDGIVDADLPGGPGGQSTLYSNPIQPVLEFWSKRVGPKIWKYVANTREPYGIFVKPWPEPMKWLFITRHRQPPTWVEAHRQWIRKTEQGAMDSFKLGTEMTRKLSQEDQQLLGRLFRGEPIEAELRALRNNPEWQAALDAVKTARSKFDEYGALAAEQKLLKQETFFKNYGRYMPRLYRRWEVDYDAQLRKFGARRPTRLDLDRFRARKDIPEEIRAMMGEIEEPGYPVAKGLAQLIHDVETMKLFNFVNDNPQWAFEPETLFSLGKDPKMYTLMPETPKLGPLSGKYVDKYIASELNQMTRARGELAKVSRRLVTEWKVWKVIFNPPTHGRNMISNTMLAYLDGLPPWRVDIYAKAMRELWAQKGPHYDTAKEQGLFAATFARGELDTLLDSWNSSKGGIYERVGRMAENFSEGKVAEGLGDILPSTSKAGVKAAKIYQAEEAWFKLARYIQEIENGATPKAAAAQAQKALFDYTEVPPFVNWARTSPVGAPFLTFTYKALPQILETGVTHPWRLASLVVGIYAMEEAARQHLDIDEDQLEFIKRIMPDRMRGDPLGLGPKALLLPFTDKYGQLQFMDLTYILPWGDIGETGATGIYQGSPIHAGPMRVIYEISINKSAFTGQEIYSPNDSKKVVAQKISDHLWKFAAPSLAPGGYGFERIWKSVWGQEDYFGRVSAPVTAIASSIIGLKTNPINPDIELFFRQREFEEGFDEITAAAYKVQNHQGLSEEEKIAQLEELRERMRVLQEIAQEMLYGEPQPAEPQGEPQVQPEQ